MKDDEIVKFAARMLFTSDPEIKKITYQTHKKFLDIVQKACKEFKGKCPNCGYVFEENQAEGFDEE